ncbi:hypothetical protein BVG79_p1000176 (plasmid) [Ketogulonicigenium robustum]|uniref:Uncharacterized protein n=1 Tax=Ketogulonicigenium robustum TaxID=92947 RepID=A0A1W6P391_9RHOB|nr:hypothetical protein BVG79_p1000176 [Ketogulonicigenium robustum]
MIRTLHDRGAMCSAPYTSWDGQLTPDYYAHLPENKAPRGRSIRPADEDGNLGYGSHPTGQLEDFVWDKGDDIAFETAPCAICWTRTAWC